METKAQQKITDKWRYGLNNEYGSRFSENMQVYITELGLSV